MEKLKKEQNRQLFCWIFNLFMMVFFLLYFFTFDLKFLIENKKLSNFNYLWYLFILFFYFFLNFKLLKDKAEIENFIKIYDDLNL
ncbi:hypothetical protein [Spiroplasma tabanidicola]|uniref:Uncharacterized protein n=1 Tax=Spiroplasma tabanidicola TaxID=324079 RepID=A0A6I6C968_9MOLU|nr:hypothetical protein [Spiroplasma tabanidicola]QGS51445.1 hypothetical protein STABA_v1c00780 [Spiroplasma tabanidicola]